MILDWEPYVSKMANSAVRSIPITKCCTAIHFKYGHWWDFIKQKDYDYACYLGGGLAMTMLFLGGGLMHMLTARSHKTE
jgi:hypothetical protein